MPTILLQFSTLTQLVFLKREILPPLPSPLSILYALYQAKFEVLRKNPIKPDDSLPTQCKQHPRTILCELQPIAK